MLAFHASNIKPDIIAETLFVARMLLTFVAERYYGVHKAFFG